ncbi:MAG: oxygen-dependent coproporphyrinogen oxidase [Bacteroidetes bacterium]|nr:oxygen-dependent coproporphyrinogen oxidase [Bacteroidota bacterium]
MENNFKDEWVNYIHSLQDKICEGLENIDGCKFVEDKWEREGGGGGKTRVIENGNVFEKGGVNTSVVFGNVSEEMKRHLKIDGYKWFACGLSLVLHPNNPFVPTIHCNYRMFELYDENENIVDRWFGGGTDLTPYYLFEEDAVHFHKTYKDACDLYNEKFYPEFKLTCDNYFVNHHRNNERRGLGGIFYDHCRPDDIQDLNFWFNFSKECGNAFLKSYLPIVERRMNIPFTEKNKFWQEIRRGRYVEFNLLHDRGTIFGLKTNGRTESILMSLPPTVRFNYNYQPSPGTEEEKLQSICLHPVDWV